MFVCLSVCTHFKPLNHLLTYLLTYLLTPCCIVLLEQQTGLQPVKKFPAFHGTRRFITALTSVRHLSLSWASSIQSTYPHPTSCRFVLILSTHLRLGPPSGLFPSGFPTKTLYTASPHRYVLILPTHLRLGLPSGLLPYGFSTKTLYTPLSPPDKMYLRFQNILIKNTSVTKIQKHVCRSNIRYSSFLYSGGFRLK